MFTSKTTINTILFGKYSSRDFTFPRRLSNSITSKGAKNLEAGLNI